MTPVTDPKILAGLNDTDQPKPVTDPNVLAELNSAKRSSDVDAMSHTLPHSQGERALGFLDEVGFAAMDNPGEKELFLKKRFGDDKVSRYQYPDGKVAFFVQKEGRNIMVDEKGNMVAQTLAESPELAGMAAGAVSGAEAMAWGGPWGATAGAIGGAGIGAVFGKTVKEGVKAGTGTYEKTPKEYMEQVKKAYESGIEGETLGRGGSVLAKKFLSSRLPSLLTGTTPESRAATEKAWAGGARPPYASMAPDAKKLQRIEVVSEKISGRYAQQDKVNAKYVLDEVRKTLEKQGIPKQQLDALMTQLENPSHAMSTRETGELLKSSVQAHIDTLQSTIDTTAKEADLALGTQLDHLKDVLDRYKPGDLGVDVDAGIRASRKQFGETFRGLYDKILKMTGDEKIVPVEAIRAEAAERVAALPKTTVTALVREMSKLKSAVVEPEDAVLLQEFGMEIPKSGGITLKDAQRIRSVLREKSAPQNLTRNITQGEFSKMAGVVDDAIYAAGENPQFKPVIDLLKQTDEAYGKGISKFKDLGVKRLVNQMKSGIAPDPTKVAETIVQKGQEARVREIQRMVGPEVSNRIAAADFGSLLKRTSVTDEAGKQTLNGMKLLTEIKNRGDSLMETVYGKETANNIKELARALASRAGKVDATALNPGNVKKALEDFRSAEKQLDTYLKTNALAELRNPTMDPEAVYQWIVKPGTESRIIAAAQQFGENSPQMQSIRQAALESLARNASLRSIDESGNRAIEATLEQYTKKQQELLFPNGMAEDLRKLSETIKFIFPFKSGVARDPGMAGMHAGAVMEQPIKQRLYQQAVASMTRFVALHPTVARWIVTGRDPNTPWIQTSAEIVKNIIRIGAVQQNTDTP